MEISNWNKKKLREDIFKILWKVYEGGLKDGKDGNANIAIDRNEKTDEIMSIIQQVREDERKKQQLLDYKFLTQTLKTREKVGLSLLESDAIQSLYKYLNPIIS